MSFTLKEYKFVHILWKNWSISSKWITRGVIKLYNTHHSHPIGCSTMAPWKTIKVEVMGSKYIIYVKIARGDRIPLKFQNCHMENKMSHRCKVVGQSHLTYSNYNKSTLFVYKIIFYRFYINIHGIWGVLLVFFTLLFIGCFTYLFYQSY